MRKISPIKSRILYFIDSQNITKQYFCDITEISYENLRGKSLESEIGGQQISKIISVFREISPEWLLTGEGEMLKQATEQKEVLPCGSCVEKDRIIKNLNDLIDRLRGGKK